MKIYLMLATEVLLLKTYGIRGMFE